MQRLLVVLALTATACATRVPNGMAGLYVHASSGVDRHVLGPGLYWHAPWNHIILYPAQWDTHDEKIDVLTADDVHLTIEAGIALRPNLKELYDLEENFGTNWYEDFAESAFFTATRTVLALYNMTDIPENSEKIEAEIQKHVAERIAGNHIELGRVALQHIDYPPSVQTAIEARLVIQQKQTAKDAELKIAQGDAEIARIQAQSAADTERIAASADADAARIRAEGESQAQALLAKTLTPLLVQLRALTSQSSRLVFVPEGKQMQVVLDGTAGAAAASAAGAKR